MATQQLIISVAGGSTQSANLNSTKVKVVSNVACWFAVGTNPVAYSTGNCALLPANVVRDINVGPANLTIDGNTSTVISSVNPKVAFLSTSGTAGVSVTEIGFVDFTRVQA
jgi:hypothetical protein